MAHTDSPFRLHASNEKFVVRHHKPGVPAFVVDRLNERCFVDSRPFEALIAGTDTGRDCYGVLGVVRLLAGPYLIVITKRKFVGSIRGHNVYQAAEAEILCYKRGVRHLSEQQRSDEARYTTMLKSVLKTHQFYFSYTYELTHTVQRQMTMSVHDLQDPLWKRADERFVWNKNMLQPLRDAECEPWILPVMSGHIEITKGNINNHTFDFILISRRGNGRQGTRFNCRGIDLLGNVANFAETEQLVQFNGHVCSYLQTRGSIPLFWKQKVNMKYMPKAILTNNSEHDRAAFRKHMDDQVARYGRQVLVDLVDHKGFQLDLGNAYSKAVTQHGDADVRYVGFDFHHECRKMKYENLQKLDDMVSADADKHGYFECDGKANVLTVQNGVMRVNCVDCLDRTNVVQTRFARRSLQLQLQNLGILSPTDVFASYAGFERCFRNVWANNADAISFLYSGTGALKNDFTRTGKRNTRGMLNDGINSATRYVLNNLMDGDRQDSITLWLGKHVVHPSEDSPFTAVDGKANLLKFLAMLLCVFMSLLFAGYSLGHLHDGTPTYIHACIWAFFFFMTHKLVIKGGKKFTNVPRLGRIDDL